MENQKAPKGHFALLYFASAASFTKKQAEFFAAPSSVATLFKTLEAKYPGISGKVLASCALTVNLDYIDMEDSDRVVIQEFDEVAIIPPVSSG